MNDNWLTAKEEIRIRIDLPDLIGESVSLRRSGNRWTGLCPFHNEKTPSFTVSADGFYKCFGCGTAGDVFQFVMETRGVRFVDAVRFLAERAGVDLPESTGSTEPKEDLQQARDLMTLVATWYERVIEKSPQAERARQYWLDREFTGEQRQQWSVGYAPEGDALAKLLSKKGFTPQYAARFGLIQKRGSRYVDRLAGRLVFPIRNRYGQICGFAGRSLTGDQHPKYLNSPQTPLFDKGNLLFGLSASLKLRARETVLITEGYFDVFRALSFDVPVVAPMGTALTENQVHLICRAFDTAILVFDGDAAGHKATLRSIPLIANAAMEVRVGSLAADQDLDSVAKSRKALDQIVASAQPGIEFLIDATLPEDGSLQQRQLAARDLGNRLGELEDQGLRDAGARRAGTLLQMPVTADHPKRFREANGPAKNEVKGTPPHVTDEKSDLALQLAAAATDNPSRTGDLLASDAYELLDADLTGYLEKEAPCPAPLAGVLVQYNTVSDTDWQNLLKWGIRVAQRRHRQERIQRLEQMAETARSGDWPRYLKLMKSLENLAAQETTDH